MDTALYKDKIEEDVLKLMEEKLSTGEMSADRARDIARFVLKALKDHFTYDEMYKLIQTFDDNFPELQAVVLPIIQEYEVKVSSIVKSHVIELIKGGKSDQASDILQKTLKKQVKLGY